MRHQPTTNTTDAHKLLATSNANSSPSHINSPLSNHKQILATKRELPPDTNNYGQVNHEAEPNLKKHLNEPTNHKQVATVHHQSINAPSLKLTSTYSSSSISKYKPDIQQKRRTFSPDFLLSPAEDLSYTQTSELKTISSTDRARKKRIKLPDKSAQPNTTNKSDSNNKNSTVKDNNHIEKLDITKIRVDSDNSNNKRDQKQLLLETDISNHTKIDTELMAATTMTIGQLTETVSLTSEGDGDSDISDDEIAIDFKKIIHNRSKTHDNDKETEIKQTENEHHRHSLQRVRPQSISPNLNEHQDIHHHFIPNQRHEKITEAQLDSLSTLIKIIRNGTFMEFSEMLEQRGFKKLLNVFVDGQTPLHYSLIYGRSLAWCQQLILNGANPNLTNRAGWHPIHLAAFSGSRETMRYLIDCIAN